MRRPAIEPEHAPSVPAERLPRRGRGGLTARRAVPLAVLAAISTLAVTTASIARPPSTPSAPGPAAFRTVVIEKSGAGGTAPPPSIEYRAQDSPAQIGDFVEQGRSFEPRANPDQPVRAESLLKPTPRPTPPPNPSHVVSGSASWYCMSGVSPCHDGYPGGLYAAAGAELRVGNWVGRTVSVCGSGTCVNVTLIDSCACGGSRVIDLYSDAFRRLAPLSSGTLSVKVAW